MIIDALTIAGFVSAASFLLMPLMMGREFVRVQAPDQLSSASITTPSKRLSKQALDNLNALRTSRTATSTEY
ncbi:hypothetical protein U5801_16110 [Lamprobacter modestohalophilus]|uniref:Uncharacterized protein n=1 Tax=Lamprobacter modestohalophilus TaxID=1064514 RepID=A0A9X0W893_9GAMM|nr:hypothetical protein [Lamprobacter modestohalophilus]MCF7979425.1 hypothetical protein [Chromatiaceae bacterium]MBK1618626.1 hypothetical protein [Lamprobacter modestohalophilus]MCF7996353.1 hypothetical protein [Chromatiaceae bacterium]MCF8014141.1 hypothetical protein [Chromatiaceae bacterium]MEA1051318.1 hypothetical protein [Lamprobacter modestohalophilus]